MGIPIHGKDGLYNGTGQRFHISKQKQHIHWLFIPLYDKIIASILATTSLTLIIRGKGLLNEMQNNVTQLAKSI